MFQIIYYLSISNNICFVNINITNIILKLIVFVSTIYCQNQNHDFNNGSNNVKVILYIFQSLLYHIIRFQ